MKVLFLVVLLSYSWHTLAYRPVAQRSLSFKLFTPLLYGNVGQDALSGGVRMMSANRGVDGTVLENDPPSDSNIASESSNSIIRGSTAQLRTLLEKMPVEDKYILLLQSYCSSILDRSAEDSSKVLKAMLSLYTEMLSLSIIPNEKANRALLNAGASFCNSDKVSQIFQLMKVGGSCKAFGALCGRVTNPITTSVASKAAGGLLGEVQVPSDEREVEVLYATAVGSSGLLYVILQVLGHTINDDVIPYATLVASFSFLLGGIDIWIRQGKGLKYAAAGIDRLVLNDEERENHSEAAAFLAGYLLGLPCFAFQPEVSEALKMLCESPGTLEAYKQPFAKLTGVYKSKKSAASGGSNGGGALSGWLSNVGGGKKNTNIIDNSNNDNDVGVMDNIMNSQSLSLAPTDVEKQYEEQQARVQNALLKTSDVESSDLIGLGRVLIWIMVPVAAEMLKYGKTIVSDPRRGKGLLDALSYFQKSDSSSRIDIPESSEDQDALLKWAYFEALSVVKQYGDLIEDVGDYLGSGTSSVGECVALVEQELTA
jgi:hypothetical protein